MNEAQKAAVLEEIAETQAVIDSLQLKIDDYNAQIAQIKKSAYQYQTQVDIAKQKVVALQEGM